MYASVGEVVPRDDFTLYVRFDDGEQGFLDMKPLLGFGVFQRLRDKEAFRRVHVAFDTVEWDCGVDLDPEFVHDRCQAQVAV